MVHHNSCPVCSSPDIALRIICTDHFKSGETFPVWTCSLCGFSFTQDHPDENSIGKYYESDDYISHNDTSKGLVNHIYRSVRRRMLKKKRNLIKNATGLETGSILDIGCGTGYFAAEMKNAGWRIKGIEINDKARNIAIENFGLEVISPDKISTLEPASFDCITLWHVLEHLSNLSTVISDIKRILKPGGTCIIALPNINSSDFVHYGPYWAALDVPRHLWHFNPDTFGFLFEGRGFRITGIKPLPLDVFYISVISEKYKGNSLAFLTGMFKGLLFALRALFNKRKSSSLIFILNR